MLYESLGSLHQRLSQRELSVKELTETSLQRIRSVDGQVQAFITVLEKEALEQAEKMDELFSSGDAGLLTGLPMGLKDNICTRGIPTTCGSKLLANYVPVYDATVAEKLAQSVLVGKTNMDEFAMGSSTENSGFKPAYNPWNTACVPGGSSGGSAVAVAAGEVAFALGSDTGGSIRQPAAFCGVVGLKPTYGRVSRYGLVAFASSLDQIGSLTRSVEDAAHVLKAIAGYDKRDSTSSPVDVPDYAAALTGEIRGMKIAVIKEMMGEGIDSGVRDKVREALATLERLGAHVEEVSLPHSDYAVPTYYVIAPAEASSNLARYDGVRYGVRQGEEDLMDMYVETRSRGFGDEVKRRIMLGTYVLSSGYYDAYYLHAQKVRTLICQDFDKVFSQYDVVVGPTTPTVAFPVGEKTDNPLTMYLDDICTILVNLAGLPAISVPCGLLGGLPVGLQIIGKAFDEATILRVAHAFEQATTSQWIPPFGGEAR